MAHAVVQAALLLLVLVLLTRASSLVAEHKDSLLERLHRHEIVNPSLEVLQGLQFASAASSLLGDRHAGSIRISITAFGRSLTLQLQHHTALLGPNYVEEVHDESGNIVSSTGDREHCYYHGYIVGHESSSLVALSTCDGVHGMIELPDETYYLDPVTCHHNSSPLKSVLIRPHYIYRKSDLKATEKEWHTCESDGLQPPESLAALEQFIAPQGPLEASAHEKRNAESVYYVELAIANDAARTARLGNAAASDAVSAVNIAAARYLKANFNPQIQLVLVAQKSFQANPFSVSTNPNVLLENWCKWADSNNSGNFAHDAAHLLSGLDFDGSTTGLAWVGTMCSKGSSCGVEQSDFSRVEVTGNTLAHEIGHNFNAQHDSPSTNGCDDSAYVMAAVQCSNCPDIPQQFSTCSTGKIQDFLTNGRNGVRPLCLANTPTRTYKATCGNGIKESGEDCDCGDRCSSSTCCTSQCRWRSGAQCDNQDACCTSDCHFKSSGTVCRAKAPTKACDVEERCTGTSAVCPGDVVLPAGTACGSGGQCTSSGQCSTLAAACASYPITQFEGGPYTACGTTNFVNYDPCKLYCAQAGGDPNRCTTFTWNGQTISPCGVDGKCVNGKCY
mmetsp:Transcript_3510/g.8430  ORF Transcript_3510/g.8430 Transcript_3510/m.8430 type:complete len:616 (-) Transcript_3510:111-1958(-)|eukprot:CAMPEP_0177654814 /NCGR_PEP_ID=MMETSP0447-20121125/14563_1 /TAXON_ID=0 /ORGANISM="Stygamoeba regulata, Strain BSH-02190019" /LENGTH=615 /DNA_ID=CAMNT_0019158549 /DNA_START=30 /DNA_END=1877 /DNA_ORIENTATION=+